MAILIICTCGKLQRVPYSYEGKEVRCLSCGALIRVAISTEKAPEQEEKVKFSP